MKKLLISLIILALVLIPIASMARTNVFLSFGVGIPAPVYVAPAPVFVAPQPVIVAPNPVYVQPAPVIISPYGQVIKYKYKPYEYDDDDDD
ncbi:MAG: hypothetical protein L0Y68_05630 [Candidatus Dadabacteria bacterium]|nr:hypothetical protein [Candidatus Dadabacteria bacterium]